jgi:hypothetical protein
MNWEGGSKPSRPQESGLAVKCEVVDPVLLPALFAVLSAEWFFFAVADGSNAIDGDSLLHQRFRCGLGAVGAERDVVLLGSTVVTMAFDEHFDAGMLMTSAG